MSKTYTYLSIDVRPCFGTNKLGDECYSPETILEHFEKNVKIDLDVYYSQNWLDVEGYAQPILSKPGYYGEDINIDIDTEPEM